MKQTFTTGSGTFKGTTWDGDRNYLKWGSYHPSPGNATNTFTSPIMATTLQAATAGFLTLRTARDARRTAHGARRTAGDGTRGRGRDTARHTVGPAPLPAFPSLRSAG